jgi:phage-related protein
MKKYIFTESQIKKVIDSVIAEQSTKKNPPTKTQKPPVTDFQGSIKGKTLTIETEDNYTYITQLVDSKGIQGSVRGDVKGKSVVLEYPKNITLMIA